LFESGQWASQTTEDGVVHGYLVEPVVVTDRRRHGSVFIFETVYDLGAALASSEGSVLLAFGPGSTFGLGVADAGAARAGVVAEVHSASQIIDHAIPRPFGRHLQVPSPAEPQISRP
jgi:hypothetical protein